MDNRLKMQMSASASASESSADRISTFGSIAGIANSAAQENARLSFMIDDAKKVARQFSTQIVNKAVLSIGSRTGNYVLQEQVQSSVNLVTKIASIGFAFATNPVVGAFTIVSDGIGLALDIAQRNREIMWQNRNASELARRAGYLSDQNR